MLIPVCALWDILLPSPHAPSPRRWSRLMLRWSGLAAAAAAFGWVRAVHVGPLHGRFRPLEPGAEAAQWMINGTTLTYAMHGLKHPEYSRQPHTADPRGLARSRVAASP